MSRSLRYQEEEEDVKEEDVEEDTGVVTEVVMEEVTVGEVVASTEAVVEVTTNLLLPVEAMDVEEADIDHLLHMMEDVRVDLVEEEEVAVMVRVSPPVSHIVQQAA